MTQHRNQRSYNNTGKRLVFLENRPTRLGKYVIPKKKSARQNAEICAVQHTKDSYW